MNTQITHSIQQHVSQPDRLGNICASNTRSQHVRSELLLRQPQLGGGDVLRFLIGTIAISCNETSRAFGFIRNRFGCGAANRESSIVLPSECACVCVCICGCAGVFARVCVWKFVYAECKNKPHERRKERKKQQHQANHLFRVQENNKKNSAEMAKTKIESALKMLNLFIIPANRDSHWSRRGAARSEENLFICHRDWSDSIDCLIDLFLHLICDARAATRNVTGASASPIHRSIDRVFNSSWSPSEVVFCVWNLKKLPPSIPLSCSLVCAAPGQQLCWFVYRATSSIVWRNQIDRRRW